MGGIWFLGSDHQGKLFPTWVAECATNRRRKEGFNITLSDTLAIPEKTIDMA